MSVTTITPNAGDSIQALLDAAPAGDAVIVNLTPGVTYTGDVFPIWIHRSNVAINGGGRASAGQFGGIRSGTSGGTGLIIAPWKALAGDERSANPLSGSRVAYYLPAGRWLMSWGDSPSVRPDPANSSIPDGWGNVRKLTIEVAVQFSQALSQTQFLCGMESRGNGTGSVVAWALYALNTGGGFDLQLAFADGTSATARLAPAGSETALRKITVQFDLDAGTCSGWIDDVVNAVTLTGWHANMPKLAANYGLPFAIGSSLGAVGFTLAGFRCDLSNQYVGGSPIVATNARYWRFTSTMFGLEMPSGTETGTRYAMANFNGDLGLAPIFLIIQSDMIRDVDSIGSVEINDLQIIPHRSTGACVSFAGVLNLTFRRCRFAGGFLGVVQMLGMFESYPVRFYDCYIDGSDQAFHFFTGEQFLYDVDTGVCGRRVGSFDGGGGCWRGGTTNNPPSRCETFIYWNAPQTISIHLIDNVFIDDESGRSGLANFVGPFTVSTSGYVCGLNVCNMILTDNGGGRQLVTVTNSATLFTLNTFGVTYSNNFVGAGKKLADLPAAPSVSAGDLLYLVRGGVDYKATVGQLP